jgi:cell division protein FtsL
MLTVFGRLFGGPLFIPVAAVIALLLAVGVLKSKGDAAAASRRVAALERELEAKRREAHALEAELQFLENPARIEALARRELGMAPASPDQYISLDAVAPVEERR